MLRDRAEVLAVIEFQAPIGDVAEAVRLLQDSIEHRREVAWRGVDHLKHFGGRSLLLERFPLFRQQPRILAGNDRLVGACRDEFAAAR